LIVVDEYLAIRSLLGVLPEGLPDEPLAITTSAHWRLLQRVHAPAGGQLSQALSGLPASDREALRFPHREVLDVLDPRPRLDEAAQIAARFGKTGWLIAETVTAGLTYGGQLWFGSDRNVGVRLREIADELGVEIHIAA
jgi:hypothetical protein